MTAAEVATAARALAAAAEHGRLDILERLLKAKANPNPERGSPPLMLAATLIHKDSAKIVAALLDAAAPLSSLVTTLTCCCRLGMFVICLTPPLARLASRSGSPKWDSRSIESG